MSGLRSTTTPSSQRTPGPVAGYDAQARSRVYAYLSRAFLYPDQANADYLLEETPPVTRCLRALGLDWSLSSLDGAFLDQRSLEAAYLAAFGHTISKECPPYEAEYGQADVFQKSQALADIGGFYRAFGVEPRLLDRLDHLSVELEFVQFLALKEAYATARQHGEDRLALCREAQACFLEEHLGCWVGSFALRLTNRAGSGPYGPLANLLARFVAWDMGRYGLEPPPPVALSQEGAPEPPCAVCPGPTGPGGAQS